MGALKNGAGTHLWTMTLTTVTKVSKISSILPKIHKNHYLELSGGN